VRVLLVEPAYHTRFPPLGLLKLAAYHKFLGNAVELVRFPGIPRMAPEKVYVTSLYTWAWRPVWEAVRFYKSLFPKAKVWLGGLYASLMPRHAAGSGADHVHVGVFEEAEDLMPAYDLVPEWDGSIIFSSRGCRSSPKILCRVWVLKLRWRSAPALSFPLNLLSL